MRKLALALVALALLGASVRAGDMDVKALAAKLAAQEAMITDLERKMAYQACEEETIADGLTSLRKNATVTIGGLLTTGVHVGRGKADRRTGTFINTNSATHIEYKMTDMTMSDAELYVQIDVSDNFDAFLLMDLHSVGDEPASRYGIAKSYYVRWKNICNTGFGLKVGRDRAAFGDSDNQAGYLDTWVVGGGDGMGWFGVRHFDDMNPAHNGWKYNGVTQFTPYWEGLDGALKIEASLFQNAWNGAGYIDGVTNGYTSYWNDKGGTRKYRSKNMGLGSGSLRVQYTPIEDLTFTAGVINFHSKSFLNSATGEGFLIEWGDIHHAANNTATNLAFRYTPCWFDKLTVWGQYVHGWNVDNQRNVNSDAVNAGASLALTDSMSVFVQGDYLKTDFRDQKRRANGWAVYAGMTYKLPVGAVLEAGWRHELVKWKEDGAVDATARTDTVYANIGFEF